MNDHFDKRNNSTKSRREILLLAILSLLPLPAQADGVLLDFNDGAAYNNRNAQATVANFKAAGIVEPLTNLEVTSITADIGRLETTSRVVSESSPLTIFFSTPPEVFSTRSAYDNNLMDDYFFLRGDDSSQVTLSGLSTFLTPEKEYYLYLFGYGDRSGQDSEFTFENITQSPVSDQLPDENPGTALDRFCKYRFTTESTVADSLNFLWEFGPHGSFSIAALNGLAIVPVPEETAPVTCLQISQIESLSSGGSKFLLTWPSEEGERYFLDFIINERRRARFRDQQTAHYADGAVTRRLVYSPFPQEIVRTVEAASLREVLGF